MAFSPGDRLGPYEILAALGAGGMGEVYKAHDTRLGRVVAVKTSQAGFGERFEREARTVAALNHPNICQIYDVGPDYFVMELVDGVPVSRVESARKLLDVAVQIADGLSAAHAAGVVHRDLKPDNILVTREGRVKILDFGLAKATMAATVGGDDPTRTAAITEVGSAVGTVAYMSPEQARGEPNLTTQSDQFSFGLVLYELASGRRPFQRTSTPETMTAIIREDADPLPDTVPAPLRWSIERLLAKDRGERYDSTRDLYRELKQIRDRLSQSTTGAQPASLQTPAKAHRARWLPWIAAAALAVASSVLLWVRPTTKTGPDLSRYRFTPLSLDYEEERTPAWSPDGKVLAYTARLNGIHQIMTRAVGSPDAARITNTTSDSREPVWSPDGATIYYNSGGGIWSVPATGGAPEKRLDSATLQSLHPDGATVAFSRAGKLWIGALDGSRPPREFSSPAETGAVAGWSFSPDGRSLAFASGHEVWLLPYPSGDPRKVTAKEGARYASVSWFPDGRSLLLVEYIAANNGFALLRLGLDGSRRYMYTAVDTHMRTAALAPDGKRIAYVSGSTDWSILEVSLQGGFSRSVVAGGGVAWWPDWAPNGNQFLVCGLHRVGQSAIEVRSTHGDFSRRLVEGSDPSQARWSPDGSRIVYTDAGPRVKVVVANASGGSPIVLDENSGRQPGSSWSPDGQWIAHLRRHDSRVELVKRRASSRSTPVLLADGATGNSGTTDWSPTGAWILYPVADGHGLVSPDGKSKRKLTSRRFRASAFSRDGRTVYGIEQNTTGKGPEWLLFGIDVESGAERQMGPVDLPPGTATLAGLSVHPDGKRFLTSAAKWPFDIWMLEGFDDPASGN